MKSGDFTHHLVQRIRFLASALVIHCATLTNIKLATHNPAIRMGQNKVS